MATIVIGRMEEVSLRSVWTNEERNFTPWLMENLDLLSDAVGVVFHSPQREVMLGGSGRADIVAKIASDDADETAVIENQIGQADGDHLERLLGLATVANLVYSSRLWTLLVVASASPLGAAFTVSTRPPRHECTMPGSYRPSFR